MTTSVEPSFITADNIRGLDTFVRRCLHFTWRCSTALRYRLRATSALNCRGFLIYSLTTKNNLMETGTTSSWCWHLMFATPQHVLKDWESWQDIGACAAFWHTTTTTTTNIVVLFGQPREMQDRPQGYPAEISKALMVNLHTFLTIWKNMPEQQICGSVGISCSLCGRTYITLDCLEAHIHNKHFAHNNVVM